MNKKITLYLLSASLITLSEGYALFGFGDKQKKNDPKTKVEKMVKEGFPSATFGSCTKTDGGVRFDIAIRYYQDLFKTDPTLAKTYDDAVNKKLAKLKECAQKKNPNFTKALAASCNTYQGIIPKEWTRSQALCEMVSGKQSAVEAKNEAINFMKQDYGSSKFACSKDYGKISWSGATEKFKRLNSDPNQNNVFEQYRKITDDHLEALSKCTVEKNKNFAAVLHESCTKDAPNKQWKNAVKLCAKAAKIMEDRGAAADANAQAKIDDKLFPGMLAKIGCTKAVAAPFDPVGLTDYLKRQADSLGQKGISAKEKAQAMENGKRVFAYVDRLYKCAVNQGDVNFNKVLAEKFADSGKNCHPSEGMKEYAKNPKLKKLVIGFYGKEGLCKTVNTTSKNIGNSNTVAEAKKALGVPSNRLGWIGFPTSVVEKLGNSDNFEHLTQWFKLDKDGFDKHFGIILKGVSIGKNGKVANPKSVALLSEGCKDGGLAAFAKKSKMDSITEVCRVAGDAGTEHGRQNTVADAFNTLKVPSALMAPAAYKICNEVMTDVWQNEDGINAIKTILANDDALPRWQKHIAGIYNCISSNDSKTGITENPIMTSYIVAAGDELKKLNNQNLKTLVADAGTIQERKEKYLEEAAGVEANVDEDDVANMDDEVEASESHDTEEADPADAEVDEDATVVDAEEEDATAVDAEEEVDPADAEEADPADAEVDEDAKEEADPADTEVDVDFNDTATEAAEVAEVENADDLGETDDFAEPGKPNSAIEAEDDEEIEWLN